MKYVLIMFILTSQSGPMSGVTQEFDSKEACDAAADSFTKIWNPGKNGRDIYWICTPKT